MTLFVKSWPANCFWLLVPVFIWNAVWFKKLPAAYQPEIFSADIPFFISLGENLFRAVIFFLPLFMKFSLSLPRQKAGAVIYLFGIILYFASWLMQVYLPGSAWSISMAGFMAPAVTPVLWLTGIWLIGSEFFLFGPRVSLVYILSAVVFTVFHSCHSFIVFKRIY